MKLFQRLLVAPAALGLFSPLAANATEVNLDEIANYSDVESVEFVSSFDNSDTTEKPLLAGGEGLVDNQSYDGGFSETTTASFSVDFAIGAVDGAGLQGNNGDPNGAVKVTDGNEDLQATYGFQIDLNTSFTGEDSLDISLDAGNANGSLAEFDFNGPDESLTVDGVSYTFPLGDKTTVIVGDNTDGSALFTTACAYGGPSNTLDDCGNVNAGITNGGAMIGASYDFGSGVTAAFGYAGDETGLMTDEGIDAYGANIAYTADNYGLSLTYGVLETATDENNYTALNGYYSFDSGISVSAGFETGDIGGALAAADESTAYFVGINGAVGAGELGVAMGTNGSMTEVGGTITEELMYEAYYSYPVNDGMTITPLIYVKEDATVGDPDQTGIMVKTSFSF